MDRRKRILATDNKTRKTETVKSPSRIVNTIIIRYKDKSLIKLIKLHKSLINLIKLHKDISGVQKGNDTTWKIIQKRR